MPKNPTWLRYEPDENISRHAAADDECCYEMETQEDRKTSGRHPESRLRVRG